MVHFIADLMPVLYKNIKAGKIVLASTIFFLFAFIGIKTRLTTEKIVFGKLIFKINVPPGFKKIGKSWGGHGLTFSIVYSDTSSLYYTDDHFFVTPNAANYRSTGFTPLPGGLTSDSTMGGRSANGKYWKEIYRNGYWLGYKNVTEERKSLFDLALTTVRKRYKGFHKTINL